MNKTTDAILACVDGSSYTDSVCAQAAWAAQRLQAPVQVLHVQPTHTDYAAPRDLSGAIGLGAKSSLLEKLTQVDEERGKLDNQKGKVILEHASSELTDAGIGGEVTPIVTLHRRGSLVETISELEATTQLILLGKRGEHADFARLHLGSNLERVVRSAHKPVMVAARSFHPIHRFVVAYDGGASTRKAIDYLAQSPLLQGLDCHLLKVGADSEENRRQLAEAESTLQQAGYTVHALLQQGHADDVLADYVKTEAMDLLVMGAYGHSHIRTLIIGSTTSNMLRSCLVPVLMFR
ncbi:MAG TPA: universal stress protein [Caldilineaceae bacterium]|nr:universal stress protein [Caldilineaceae bacterium]